MHDLTAFQRDLMWTIAGLQKDKGLAVKAELESYYDTEINHGRLYPNLDAIVDKGLVEKGTLDKRTNYYTLTSRGVRALTARHEWEAERLANVADTDTASAESVSDHVQQQQAQPQQD